MAGFEIRTADEFLALDLEGRGPARRAARERPLLGVVLRLFLERGNPVPVDAIVAALGAGDGETNGGTIRAALETLDDEDLIRLREGAVDLAYPFSAAATAFVVRLADGRERYVCCALDALGIAPMVGERVEIRSRCHHCGAALAFTVTPEGPDPRAEGVMLWLGRRTEDRCKVADSL